MYTKKKKKFEKEKLAPGIYAPVPQVVETTGGITTKLDSAVANFTCGANKVPIAKSLPTQIQAGSESIPKNVI